ncbi:MAG: EF-hand domain-containing protein [Pseudomonadota bacterium]
MKILDNTFFQKKPLVILSACVTTSLFCVQNLQANPLPQRGPIPFNSYDLNSNGSISQKEFMTVRNLRMKDREAQGFPIRSISLEPNFNQFDTNNDGQLNPDELSHVQQLQRQKMQGQRMGRRQGRGINRGRNMPKFEDFDGNKDGYISEQELIEARGMRVSNRIQQGYQMRNIGNITTFQEIDKNSDGKISPEEFSAQQKQHQMNRQRPQ